MLVQVPRGGMRAALLLCFLYVPCRAVAPATPPLPAADYSSRRYWLESTEAAFDSLSSRVGSTIDQLTAQSLSCSVYLPLGMGSNASTFHLLDFKGAGCGPPIVLLHGIGSSASDYYPIIRHLQAHCSRVVAIDFPGHGLSPCDPTISLDELESRMLCTVDQAVAFVGCKKFTLVGNSLGGLIACKYALTHSHRLSCLILLSPAGAPLTESELSQLQSLFSIKTLGDATKFTDSVLGLQRRLPWGVRHVVGWACRERTRRPIAQKILQEATVGKRLDESSCTKIDCPILLVWGKNEEVFADRQLDWWVKHLPSRRLSLLRPNGLGHVPHLDASSVARSIVEFVSSLGD